MLYTEEGTYFGRSWAGSTQNLSCNGVTVVKNAAPARAATMLGIPSLVGAHVRVVHSPDSQSRSHVESLRTANERELLVHYTMESPQMWPADLDAAYMASFDLRWSYNTRLSSAPSVYHDGGKLARRVRRPVHRVGWRSKVRGRLLTTAVSNCEDFVGRAEYVRALQREMGGEFLNVGRCSGSKVSAEQQAEIQSKKRGGFDRFVARGYFYLALENANCEGYITEKLGRALVAGVVPVVFDARLPSGGPRRPDYSTLLPPGSYVNVADFASPAALASHLRAVAANQTAYTAHLWAHNLNASQVRSLAARPPACRVTPAPRLLITKAALPAAAACALAAAPARLREERGEAPRVLPGSGGAPSARNREEERYAPTATRAGPLVLAAAPAVSPPAARHLHARRGADAARDTQLASVRAEERRGFVSRVA